MHEQQNKTILFAGGGTVGPVTPLLALYEGLKAARPGLSFHWVGTKNGPERKLVAQRHIAFDTIPTAKIDRFFSPRNLLVPFAFIAALISAYKILKRVKPDMIVAAGGFVAVPLVWMGKFMGIPSAIHQLDIRQGLANKLMAPFSQCIFVTFEPSLKDYPADKTVLTGAPVRDGLFSLQTDAFAFDPDRPVALIFGGGTGAMAINEFVWGALEELTKDADILHVTGRGKNKDVSAPHYHQREFLTDEMAEAYEKADVVVTRGGIGTLLEFAALKKPAIVIPIPGSHQEENAAMLEQHNAAVVLDQTKLSPNLFAAEVKKLLKDQEKQEQLRQNIGRFYNEDASEKMVEEILKILYSEQPQPESMDLTQKKRVHFIGIGGIGISYVARFFLQKGAVVSGSDLASNRVTDQLARRGASLFQGHSADNITDDIELVIYNDAIPADNAELMRARELGIETMTNFEAVGHISKDYETIVVAGNKGKTTTTAMLGHILTSLGFDPTSMVGSIVNEWGGNFRQGQSEYLVIEGDEFKEHFLNFNPKIVVITNMEADHLDYFGSEENYIQAFQQLIDKLPEDGLLVINADDEMTKRLSLPNCRVVRFGTDDSAEVFASGREVSDGSQTVNVTARGDDLGQWEFPFPGEFNVYNALAATTASLELGQDPKGIAEALSVFKGTWRRFQILGAYKDATVISDYAHHPTAVHATIEAARDFYPGRRIVAIFQPHTYHRTKALFDDFVRSFDGADAVLISDVYDVAGRETVSREEMNSQILTNGIKNRDQRQQRERTVQYAGDLEQTKDSVDAIVETNDVLLFMGAGTIYELAEML